GSHGTAAAVPAGPLAVSSPGSRSSLARRWRMSARTAFHPITVGQSAMRRPPACGGPTRPPERKRFRPERKVQMQDGFGLILFPNAATYSADTTTPYGG